MTPPTHLTGCLDKEGNFKAWNFGLKPVTPCLLRDTQVTLVLKAGLDAQAQAGSQADAALRSQIDGVSAARIAGDAALANDLSTEVEARTAADGGLQTRIAQSEGAIAANTVAILAAEDEIGDKANFYANSRLDALGVSSSETLGVIWYSEGGVEDPSNP